MKISLNWLKDYIDINLDPKELGDVLTSLGLEVEGMEEIESIPGGLKGLVVGHVIECGKHPNADRLSLTKVDVGDGAIRQIVCGAPNVAKGQKVVVATVGTTLYPTAGESFQIKKGNIRGEVSEGMICAEDEIGIGIDHEGIIVLSESFKIGTPVAQIYKVESDVVYEIGLTPNRSDATSHLGVARDLAAYLKINEGHSGKLTYPDFSSIKVPAKTETFPVQVKTSEGCPRFSGVVISNLQIASSPDWIKNRLTAVGVRPINNVVDITNYVLHEYGQPLHAYDLNKVGKKSIVVKTLTEGSSFVSLDGVERKLRAEDLIVCDGNEKGMCIGGVFGGADTGVSDITSNIFLEAAHFNAQWIRRTSTHHNLRTDAAKCFEKGTDPNVTIDALKRAAQLMQEYAGAKISSDFIDLYPRKVLPKEVDIELSNIHKLIGNEIETKKIEQILEALNIKIAKKSGEKYTVLIPTDKADVTREADVIEEVLRIYGFNNVVINNKLSTTIITTEHPAPHQFRNQLAEFLSAKGFHEIMGLSLVPSAPYKNVSLTDENSWVRINNTSNVHLDIMRPEMIVSGLDSVRYNMNRQQTDIRFFEFGRSYLKSGDGYDEKEHLCIYLSGAEEAESWLSSAGPATIFTIKKVVHEILIKMGVDRYKVEESDGDGLEYGLKYLLGPNEIVKFGAVSPALLKEMQVKNQIFVADFGLDLLYKRIRKQKTSVSEISKFPSMRRDLSLTMDSSVTFDAIKNAILQVEKKLINEINLFDVYKNEQQLGKGKKSYAISLIYEDHQKTLNDKQVDKSIKNIIQTLSNDLNCEIRQ